MKKLISEAPWATKLAAAIVGFMLFANLPYVIISFGHSISLKVWIATAVTEVLYLAIAYGFLRKANWVRVLWSLWTVGWFLLAIVPEISAVVARLEHSLWALLTSVIKLITVALLYLPASNQFFRTKTEPNQSLQTTIMPVTDAAAQPPRQP